MLVPSKTHVRIAGSRSSRPIAAGSASAALGLAAGELVAAYLPGARSPLTGAGKALIDLTPGPVVDMTVGLLEAYDKPALAASLFGGTLSLGMLAGLLERRWPAAGVALLGAAGAAAAGAAGSRPENATGTSLAAGLTGAATSAAALRALSRGKDSRASVLAGGFAAAGGLLAHRGARRRRADLARRQSSVPLRRRSVPSTGPELAFAVEGLAPLFTPANDFYVTDVQFPPPAVDPQNWSLRVHGMVERPFELRLTELLDLAVEELDATLVCVHNPVGGDRIGTARWHGAPVLDLLDRAGVAGSADQLVARSIDGFSAGVPIEMLRDGWPALVAVAMNGAPLTTEHGSPARLFMPGLWGADANTKWLAELEVTTFDRVVDYWDRRGWPRRPTPIRVSSRIDVPRDRTALPTGTVTVAGVAWAPPDGVTGVEVSVDDGPWTPAELSPELAPTMWRQWRLPWSARPGDHDLRVRATGRNGPQSDRWSPPYPDGSSGLHRIRVSVSDSPSPEAEEPRRLRRTVDQAAQRLDLATGAAAAWSHHGLPHRAGSKGESVTRTTLLGPVDQVALPQGPIRFHERGSGPPIVFVHGIVANGDLWRHVVPELAEDFRCITPHWPLGSHELGMKEDVDLSLPGLASIVDGFLAARGLDDVILVGNDTGGAICQAVAAYHPDRVGRLVLTSCDAFDNFLPPILRHLQVFGRRAGMLWLTGQALRVRAIQRLPIAFGRLTVRPIDHDTMVSFTEPLRANAAVRRDFARLCREISTRHTLEAAARLPSFHKPALIAWGLDDKLFPTAHAHRLAGLLPDARIEGIEGSRAFVPEDQPARLAQLIRKFAAAPVAA